MSSVEGSRQSKEIVLDAPAAANVTRSSAQVDAILASTESGALATIEVQKPDARLESIHALSPRAKLLLTEAIATSDNADIAAAAARIISDALETAKEEISPRSVHKMGQEIQLSGLCDEISEALKNGPKSDYVSILLPEYLGNPARCYFGAVWNYFNSEKTESAPAVSEPEPVFNWEKKKKENAHRRLQERIEDIKEQGIIDGRVLDLNLSVETSALLSAMLESHDAGLADAIIDGLVNEVHLGDDATVEEIADAAEAKLDPLNNADDDDVSFAMIVLSHKFRIMTGHA